VESVTRTVRLIRSKGVGVFFVTQAGRLEAAREPEHVPAPKLPNRRRAPVPEPAGIGDFLNSRQGKALQREVLRGVFGMLRKRL
jgi:hypothetical protein